MATWALEWARSKIGKSFVFAGFSPKKAGVLEATSTSGELIPVSDTTPALRALVGAALNMNIDALKKAKLTGHSLRHFLTEVATAAGWPETWINPLGRWAAPKGGKAGSKPGPVVRSSAAAYSAGTTAEELELRLHKKAIGVVANFIGASNWRDRLPVQRSGIISFDFISEAQEVDEDVSEFDDLDDISSDRNETAS